MFRLPYVVEVKYDTRPLVPHHNDRDRGLGEARHSVFWSYESNILQVLVCTLLKAGVSWFCKQSVLRFG